MNTTRKRKLLRRDRQFKRMLEAGISPTSNWYDDGNKRNWVVFGRWLQEPAKLN